MIGCKDLTPKRQQLLVSVQVQHGRICRDQTKRHVPVLLS